MWSRTSALALLGLAMLSGGCSSQGSSDSAASPRGPSGSSAPYRLQATPSMGLVPLPSPQQVAAAVRLGRLDPFSNPRPTPAAAPVRSQGAAGPEARRRAEVRLPSLPDDFVFTGVIATGGRVEALVQTGPESGSVVVGDVGDPRKPWLPRGWRVVAIDSQQGTLTLRQGGALRVLQMS